jgi:glycosyltransferase involved in cell wall biosynthesis
MTRVIIIDPSYATFTGHNHAVNSLLLEEARGRGLDALVFAHSALPAADRVIPAFRTTAYGFSPENSLDVLQHAHSIGRSFAEDLAGRVQPLLVKDTVIFVHTLNNPLLHGFVAWLASLAAPHEVTVRVGFNLPPDFRQRRQDVALWNAHQYAFALKLLTAVAPGARFYAETRELQSLFAGFGAPSVSHRRLPLRVLTPPDGRVTAGGDGRLIYHVPGEVRAEKGHEFLINGILRIAERRPAWLERIRFRFTSIGMPAEVARFLLAHGALFEIVPETSISVDRYWQLMEEADVVGCTYDPADYATRASGIFLEALALGKPVLVSNRTSVGAEVAADGYAYGIGVDFGDVDSLASGLERMVSSYDALRRGAEAVADRVRNELSAASFFDWLLGKQSGGDPMVSVP